MVAALVLEPEPKITPVDPRADVIAVPPTSPLRLASDQLALQARALPVPGDDLMRDFGITVYDRMALNPQIRAATRVLLTAALINLVQYSIPVPRTDAKYDTAARYAAFVREAFARLPRAMEGLLYEVGTAALHHGHKLTEAVWTPAKVLPNYGPQQIYADIKPKPLGTYAFVQDGYANTLGITPRGAGLAYAWANGLVGSTVIGGGGLVGGYPIYALDKFPTLTWDEADRDPRGRSLLRSIYAAWWKGQQTEPGLLAYLARFGQPSVKITMPPNTPADSTRDDGTSVKTRQVYLEAGQDWQAGGILVLAAGANGELVEASGEGTAYINAKRMWDQEMWVGLTGQSLATGEGQHRSGTDARTHQDILGLFVAFLKGWLADWVSRQLIAPLIRVNFGAAAVPLAPKADLGRINPEDLAQVLQAFAQLAGPGNYWNPAVVPPDIGAELDARVGLPQRQTAAVGPDGEPTDLPAPPAQPTVPPPTPPPQEAPT